MGSENGNAEFDQVGAGRGDGRQQLAGERQVRVAGGDERQERLAVLGAQAGEEGIDRVHAGCCTTRPNRHAGTFARGAMSPRLRSHRLDFV